MIKCSSRVAGERAALTRQCKAEEEGRGERGERGRGRKGAVSKASLAHGTSRTAAAGLGGSRTCYRT